MLQEVSILSILAAGVMNGSFIIPSRYVKNFINEKIWLYHSIIGLAIIPWIMLAIISPTIFPHYFSLPTDIVLFLIIGGIIFGMGQVCFAYAIELIGIALSFAINLGMGVIVGSMFVIFYRGAFFTTEGFFVTLSVFLIISSLFIYYLSDRKSEIINVHRMGIRYHTGWSLAFLAGLASGFQNITFFIVAFHSKSMFPASNSFWVWPPFLLIAAIIMFIGFSFKVNANKEVAVNKIDRSLLIKNISLISLMGLFFTGSLALYSNSMSKLSFQEQIAGWPTFMVSIIIASQIWGWLYGGSDNITKKSKFYKIASAGLLISAIIVLALKSK